MNIELVNDDFEISDEEKAIVESRLRIALSRYYTRIARITVKLTAAANPGQEHKKCRIEVLLRPTRTIVVEDMDIDLRLAVDRAAVKMARSVERKLKLEREI